MATDKKRLDWIAEEIRKFCRENANEANVIKYSRYFREGYNAYGIDDRFFREHWYDFYNLWKDELGLEGFLDLGDILIRSGKYEEASIAIISVEKFKKEYTPQTFNRLGKWLENGISNWAHTDVLSGNVLSYFLLNDIVELENMENWRESSSKWKRRAVPVTLIKPAQIAEDRTLHVEFIRPLMTDPERVVQQGVGWFLRVVWKKQPDLVENFLLEWKNTSPRLIIQYAAEKMTKEQKELFKREKKE